MRGGGRLCREGPGKLVGVDNRGCVKGAPRRPLNSAHSAILRLPRNLTAGAKGASIAGKTQLKPTKSRFRPFAGGRRRGKEHVG